MVAWSSSFKKLLLVPLTNMNVFQNILDIFILREPYEGYVISAHKTADEAEAEKKRLLKEGVESFVAVEAAQATNIKGEWHLLGNIISL